MAYTEDAVTATITLDSGQSVSGQRTDGYLEVDTHNSDQLFIYIDNGSTGTAPSQYDLSIDVYKGKVNDWMYDDAYTAQTTRSWKLEASEGQMRIDLTNSSGSNGQTYRILVESRVENAN